MGKENRKILKRIVIGTVFCLQTPLCISNGDNEETDIDVICNYDGGAFIPGSSFAGAMRDYLQLDPETESFMGFSKKETSDTESGQMSSLFISDTILENVKICYRDGISLKEKGHVDNKFDWEVVDTGAVGCLFMELVLREKDDEAAVMQQIKDTVYGMQKGSLRLGYRKNRGFGKLTVLDVYQWEFSRDNKEEWLSFCKPVLRKEKKEGKKKWILVNAGECNTNIETKRVDLEKWLEQAQNKRAEAVLSVPLKLCGGISIRRYATKNGAADYEHITSNGKPVIPGTSWNGAVRSRFSQIIKELGAASGAADKLTKDWFGDLSTRSSLIVVEEQPMEGGTMVQVSRNKVNRFDASTVQGALYTEVTCFGGTTKLVLRVNKHEKTSGDEWKAVIGILFCVVRDMEEGFLPVGGLTSIGRGIFKSNGAAVLEYADRKECEKAAVDWILKHRIKGAVR